MAWTVEPRDSVAQDLNRILAFLVESSLTFGEPPDRVYSDASERLSRIEAAIASLARLPYQGTRDPHLGETIRHVTKDRAVIYFSLDPNSQTIAVLAVFFGGQDHTTRMIERMKTERSQ